MKRKVFITVAIAMSLAVAVSLTVATLVFRQYEVASVQERLDTLAVDLSARDLSDGVSFTLADYTVTPKDRFDYAEDAQQRNLLYGTFTDANGENFVIWKAEPTFHDVLAHRWELRRLRRTILLFFAQSRFPMPSFNLTKLLSICNFYSRMRISTIKTQDGRILLLVADIEMKNRLEYAIATLKKTKLSDGVHSQRQSRTENSSDFHQRLRRADAGGIRRRTGEKCRNRRRRATAVAFNRSTIQFSRYDEGRVDVRHDGASINWLRKQSTA